MKGILLSLIFFLSSCAVRQERFFPIFEMRPGNIEGVVRDGHQPVPNVFIWLYDRYGEKISVARTDLNGRYITSPIPEGYYYLRLHSGEYHGGVLNYTSQFYKNASCFRDARLIRVIPGKTITGVNFSLDSGYTISGVVTDYDQNPIVNNSIRIVVYDAFRRHKKSFYKTTTDSIGRFNLTGISRGRHKIYLSAEGYVGVYYGGARRWEQADIVDVMNSIELNFSLRRGGVVSGYVRADGEGLYGVSVHLRGENEHRQVETGLNGEYLISGLLEGDYILYVWPQEGSEYGFQYYRDTNLKRDAQRIQVRGTDTLRDINLDLIKAGRINMTFYCEHQIPIQSAIGISLFTEDGEIAPVIWAVTGGNFEIPNLYPGTYIVHAVHTGFPEEGRSFVFAYYQNRERIEDARPVTVKSGMRTTGINFILREGGWVEGFVYFNGSPLSSDSILVHVILYDLDGRVVSTTTTNFNGGYRLKGVPPGEYRLAFLPLYSGLSVIYYGGGITFDDERNKILKINRGEGQKVELNIVEYGAETISGYLYDKDGEILKKRGKIGVYDGTGHLVQLSFAEDGRYEIDGIRDGLYYIRAFGFDGYKEVWYRGITNDVKTNPQDSYYFVSPPRGAVMVEAGREIDLYLKSGVR